MRKHIPYLIWLVAAGLLVTYVVRAYQDIPRGATSQIVLRFGALFLLVGGMLVRTLINRRENLSFVNFGFKLIAVGILFLLILVALLQVVLF